MNKINLPNYQKYMQGPFELPGPTQKGWILTGVCPKNEGQPRVYNLLLLDTLPVEYSYPNGKVIQPDQIMVRFDAVGACYSDIKIANKGNEHPRMQGRDLAKNPAIMGHEVSLTVIAVGEALEGKYPVGDRYVVNAETIMGGRKVTFGYKYPGAYRLYGVYGSLLLDNDDGSSLVPIPRDMSYLVAASLEPYACCFNTLDKHRPERRFVRPGGNTWFMGAGPMSRALLESLLSRGMHYPRKFAVTEINMDRMQKYRETVGRRAEEAGIEVAYVNANNNNFMFKEIDDFFGGFIDDVFLMFDAPKDVLEQLVVGALDRMTRDIGVFDVFAGLKEEITITYEATEIPLKAIHYGKNITLPKSKISVVGFSGLQGNHLGEARDAFLQKKIDPYDTMIAAVAALHELPEVLHKIEAAGIDGKCIIIPHADPNLGYSNSNQLLNRINLNKYTDSGIDLKKVQEELVLGRFSDEATMLLFDHFVRECSAKK